MRIGLPSVNSRKRFRSSGNRHGSALPLPMTPFCAMATIREITGSCGVSFIMNGLLQSYASDLHRCVEDHQVAERHAEELRCLRAVLLHAREQASLQAAEARQRPGTHYVASDEE